MNSAHWTLIQLKSDLWDIHKMLRYTETCLGCGHDWPCETILAAGMEND
jgi:hypothetical protein